MKQRKHLVWTDGKSWKITELALAMPPLSLPESAQHPSWSSAPPHWQPWLGPEVSVLSCALVLDHNDSALILIGAGSSALLAIIFSYGIHILEHVSLKKSFSCTMFLYIGSHAFFRLFFPPAWQTYHCRQARSGGHIDPYVSGAITRKTNIAVELKPNFGKTAFLYEALKAGSIDLYPEFTGTITSSL